MTVSSQALERSSLSDFTIMKYHELARSDIISIIGYDLLECILPIDSPEFDRAINADSPELDRAINADSPELNRVINVVPTIPAPNATPTPTPSTAPTPAPSTTPVPSPRRTDGSTRPGRKDDSTGLIVIVTLQKWLIMISP